MNDLKKNFKIGLCGAPFGNRFRPHLTAPRHIDHRQSIADECAYALKVGLLGGCFGMKFALMRVWYQFMIDTIYQDLKAQHAK